MADRYPLIVDSSTSTVKELPSGDNLNLQGSGVVNAGDISATSVNVTSFTATNTNLGVVTFSSTVDNLSVGVLTVTQLADDFFNSRVRNLSGIATHYTAGIGTNNLQYSGGTYTPDGKIYYGPWVGNSYYVYDTVTGVGQSVAISQDLSSVAHAPNQALYTTGVLASNNCIYFIPYYASSVFKLNLNTGVGTTIAITGVGTTGTYHGGILHTNGKIYGAPHSANAWLEINPTNDTAQRILIKDASGNLLVNSGIAYSGNIMSTQNWLGCVENPIDETIHAVPFKSPLILKFDPNSGVSTTYGEFGTYNAKFRGGVFYNGRMFFAPDSAGYVALVDPVGLTTAGIATGSYGITAYQGICAGPDGYLYAKIIIKTSI